MHQHVVRMQTEQEAAEVMFNSGKRPAVSPAPVSEGLEMKVG